MSHVVTVKIYDLGVNMLADISGIALEKSMKPRLSAGNSFTVTCPAGDPLLTAIADDGYPNLRRGNRKLVVWEDGEIIFHGRIWIVERKGTDKQVLVTITALDPWAEIGYGEDRAGRPLRDETGNFIHPTFTPSVVNSPTDAISGPDLIYQAFFNSQQVGAEGDPTPGEGPLPIDIDSGTFDRDVPDAVDLSGIESQMNWPVMLGDFVNQLVATGAVDVVMRPIEPGTGYDINGDLSDYIMVELSAYSRPGGIGTDRSATVHFDYWTGDRNASACRHLDDFTTIDNKLYDYLAPHVGIYRFAGNITPGSPDTTVDPTDSRALYGGPPGADEVGSFMKIRIIDSLDSENRHRPLYIAAWDAEQGLGVEPRGMLFITPSSDAKALYEAPADFGEGDTVAVNVGADFGMPLLAVAQRVHGYDKSWDRQGVARLDSLLTSANEE